MFSETACLQRELADVLGLSPARVSQLIKDGVLKTEAKSKRLRLGSSVQAYIAYRIGDAMDQDAAIRYGIEKAEHEAVKRQISELELAKRRGEVLPTEDVIVAWNNMIVECRGIMLGLAGRLGARLAGEDRPAVCTDMIDAEVRAVLDELASLDAKALVGTGDGNCATDWEGGGDGEEVGGDGGVVDDDDGKEFGDSNSNGKVLSFLESAKPIDGEPMG